MTDSNTMSPPNPIIRKFDRRRLGAIYNYFPVKHAWDTLAIAQILCRADLTFNQKIKCFHFYFNTGSIRNLFASLTRSGSHWSILNLTLALEIASGGDGDYSYSNHYWKLNKGVRYTKLDWREASGEIRDEKRWGVPVYDPFLFHSHHPYFRIRSANLKQMKIVIVLRDIVGSMESKFYKLGGIPDNPTKENVETFDWHRLTNDAIEFYNSWGDVLQWHPNCICIRYEDMLADPVGTHLTMARHWGLNISEEHMVKAVNLTTKEKMAEKLAQENAQNQMRVSYRKDASQVPIEKIGEIRKLLRKKLIYDFGYDYS